MKIVQRHFGLLCLTALSVASSNIVDHEKKTFRFLTKSKNFIDKTPFVKVFIKSKEHLAVFAPQGFGKSANLMMLKEFLEVQINSKGLEQDPKKSDAYKLFKNLKIGRDQEFMDENFAKYPVIYLDFRDFYVLGSKQNFEQSLREIIYVLMTKHAYLMNGRNLDDYDKQAFKKQYHSLTTPGYLPDMKFIRDFTVYLRTHYDQRCIVLIDNFDVPIMTAIFESPTLTDDQKTALSNVTSFVEALLKENEHNVLCSLSTGVDRAGYDFNFINFVIAVDHPKIGPYYGFTFEETKSLIAKNFPDIAQSQLENQTINIGLWYGGYNIKDTRLTLFNADSVLKYLNSKKLEFFWETPAIITRFKKLFSIQDIGPMLEQALVTGIKVDTKNRIPNYDLIDLRTYVRGEQGVTVLDIIDVTLQIFLENGYFSSLRYFKHQEVEAFLPNYDLKTNFRNMVYTLDYLKSKHRVTDADITDLVNSVIKLDSSQETFKTFATSALHIFKFNMPDHEYKFQASLYTFLKNSNSSLMNVIFEENLIDKIKLIVEKNDTLIVMKYRFNRESARITLGQIVEENEMDIRLKHVLSERKTFILVGIHLNSWRKCDISYLYNTFNMTLAIDLRVAPGP